MTPHRVRRPTSPDGCRESDSARVRLTRPFVTGLAVLVLAGAPVVGAAACGGSSGSTAASPSATTTAGTAPLAGSLRQAAAAYWRLMDANDFAAIAAASVPSEPPSATAATDDMVRVRLVSAKPLSRGADGPGSALVQATIHIDPTKDAQNPTPWGDAGDHTVFMGMQQAPEGGWLIRHWGTSP